MRITSPENIMIESSLQTLIIETIPLPLAGVLFSDSVHEKILRRYSVEAGVVLFERSENEYYIDSIIGIPTYNSHESQMFSEICVEINRNIESLNGKTNPFERDLPEIPILNQFIAAGGFSGARVFRIYDYLHTSGYWIMFYRKNIEAELLRMPGEFSPDSLFMVDEIKKNIEQQTKAVSYEEIVSRWVHLLDIRDKETEEHTVRVADLAVDLGKKCGLCAEELEHLHTGAFLHDIGKVVIPNDILHKPGSLTDAEWEIMKLHPRIAKELLSNLSLPQTVLDIPLYHHERWAGGGYPFNLEGEQIPKAVRIFTVADVWDALNTNRPYRERFSTTAAREYMLENMWIHFDPEVINCFFDL
jgi:HD-GYP domain-containing protein (c-di-GMP phosphodiesterase class II)